MTIKKNKHLKHLLVVAAKFEGRILIKNLDLVKRSEVFYQNKNKNIQLLVCGVGIPATVFELTRHLYGENYDLIINVGIAGAFKNTGNICDTFSVKTDFFGDIGYYDKNDFVNIFGSKFNTQYNHVFEENKLHADPAPVFFKKITAVNSVSVNIPESIEQPSGVCLETMEGAAVMMCAKMFQTKCVQIRSVSNIIRETPKDKWEVYNAIEQYSGLITAYFKTL